MSKYKAIIEEVFYSEFEVEAATPEEAEEVICDMYTKREIKVQHKRPMFSKITFEGDKGD